MPRDVVGAIAPRRAGTAIPVLPALRMAGTIVAVCAFLVLVGLFGQFATRPLVVGIVDIGHAMMLAAAMGGGAALTRRDRGVAGLLAAILAGATAGAGLTLLVAIVRAANLRWIFIS